METEELNQEARQQVRKRMTEAVQYWANQIGTYNEGCMCYNCTAKIFGEIEKGMRIWEEQLKKDYPDHDYSRKI